MSRVRRDAVERFNYSEPIIPMANKFQGDPDGYFVSDVRQGPGHSTRRLRAPADNALLVDAGVGPSDAHDATFSDTCDASDSHSAMAAVPQKNAGRCPLRGNAMKCVFVLCVALVIVLAAFYLLMKWQKRRKKKAENALLKSFILPEADRKFLEDAAKREKNALQSIT